MNPKLLWLFIYLLVLGWVVYELMKNMKSMKLQKTFFF